MLNLKSTDRGTCARVLYPQGQINLVSMLQSRAEVELPSLFLPHPTLKYEIVIMEGLVSERIILSEI